MTLGFTKTFMLGAFTISFLYFITHYFAKSSPKYSLYFAIGCLVSIFRPIKGNIYALFDTKDIWYMWIVKLDYITFILSPLFYIFIADSLFPKIGNKKVIRIFTYLGVAQVIYILINNPINKILDPFHDIYIISCILYSLFIFSVALYKKLKFSIPLFVVNVIFAAGMAHDVLLGSYIIESPLGEINAYVFFVYVCMMAVVLFLKMSYLEKEFLEKQLNFLHAQIKPHFLYNTISTIRAYSKQDTEKTGEMLDYLSTYLRGKLRKGEDMMISLKEEISLIKAYLAIEKVRFEERLNVEYDIDDDIDIIIPCLIVQPMVENAVKHGISRKSEGGKIDVEVKRDKNNVLIVIKDNGAGMDKKTMADIMDGSNPGIGISNTNERLKRYYNTEISVNSVEGVGTTFMLTIPLGRGFK